MFIGPPENLRNGFLKGEFVDDLKKYSKWSKTVYFCNGFDLHYCKSGKRVTKEEMMLWTFGRSLGERGEADRDAPRALPDGVSGLKLAENAVYKLQRYEITVKADGPMVARTYSGTNSVNRGTCFILENILFIGPQQIEPSSLGKKPFIEKLHQLPRWDQTDFFCKRFSLHQCQPGSGMPSEPEKPPYGGETIRQHDFEPGEKIRLAVKIPCGGFWQSFSKRISEIRDSFPGFLKCPGGFGRFSNSRSVPSCFLKNFSVLREAGARVIKGAAGAVAIFLSMALAIFAFINDYLKDHYESWKSKRDKR